MGSLSPEQSANVIKLAKIVKKRVRNTEIETRVLFRNKHTCCICRDYKSYQEPILHHIDGNPANTIHENLAVLCLSHASMADAGLSKGKIGSGRKLTPEEVLMHKRGWEERTSSELRIESRRITTQRKRELRYRYEFEIEKIKNEILSLRDRKEIKNRYEFLTQLYIEEAISDIPLRKFVLNAFSDISIQTVGDKQRTLPLLKALPDLFPHLVGPQEVPIYKDDKQYLMKAIEILETLGDFAASISDDRDLLKRTCKSIVEFAEIASWYKFVDFIKAVKSAMKEIRKSCDEYTDESDRPNKAERIARGKIVDHFITKINEISIK